MNICTFIARMAKDAETRQAGETTVANFSIAIDTGYGEKKGTSFFDCVAFGKTAENLTKFFHKGDKIALEAEARQERWEKDGKSFSRVVFYVNHWEFVEGKKEQTQEPKETDDFMTIPDSIQEELPFK